MTRTYGSWSNYESPEHRLARRKRELKRDMTQARQSFQIAARQYRELDE